MSNPHLTNLADALVALLDQVVLTKQSDDAVIKDLRTQLQQAQSNQDRVVLEKVAKAKSELLNPETLQVVSDRLVHMGLLDQPAMVKLAERIQREPNILLGLLLKVSERLLPTPTEGRGIEGSALSKQRDPDGWDDFANGRKVRVA